MSTKTWKNKELTTLLSEAWGFGFDLDNLNEATPRVGYGGDDEAVKPPDEEEKEIKKLEEEVEEIEEDKKGDESDTDPGAKDDTWRKGEKSKTHPGRLNKENLNEDSGEDEAWHQWKNEHADDDHIKEIEHHLRALKDDRDYERHGAEYDHDHYEDKGMEEGGSGRSDPTRLQGRDSARDLPDRKRPMEEQALRRMVRQTIRKIYQENKK